MKAISRLYQYFDYKNIRPARFEKENGLSNGYLSVQMKREANIGSSILEIVAENCQDLSLDWLITGKGNMIISENAVLPGQNAPPFCERCKMKDELIESLRQQIDTQSKLIHHLEDKECPEEGQKRKAAS